ncbi:MAG: glycosyltransferase, partial [Planctomycetes bacterium]|nr:glycosyltransferase [Planctomycetota bacterium]
MPSGTRTIQIQMMSPHDAVGGGALHARGIAQGLRRAGVRTTLLCIGDDPHPLDPDYDEIVACKPQPWPLLWRWPPLGTLPYWYRAAVRSNGQVDGVIALSPAMAVAARCVRHRAPVLYCPAVLDKVEHPDTPRAPIKWLERQAFRRSHASLFTADAVRRAVEALYGPLRIPWDICPL